MVYWLASYLVMVIVAYVVIARRMKFFDFNWLTCLYFALLVPVIIIGGIAWGIINLLCFGIVWLMWGVATLTSKPLRNTKLSKKFDEYVEQSTQIDFNYDESEQF